MPESHPPGAPYPDVANFAKRLVAEYDISQEFAEAVEEAITLQLDYASRVLSHPFPPQRSYCVPIMVRMFMMSVFLLFRSVDRAT